MKSSIIVGLQWGDEGKGKIVDVLSAKVDVVVRYQGGANAGHTVVIDNKRIILHLLPTGILQDKISVIGNGVVVDIEELINEISLIKKNGFNADKLSISSRAHILLPMHKMIDNAKEGRRVKKIGTTGRGIGPAYIDKFGRKGLRMGLMLNKTEFEKSISDYIDGFNKYEAPFYKIPKINKKTMTADIMKMRSKLLKYIIDTDILAEKIVKKGNSILFEGAQGVLLDIDFGTYPFVTSSHPMAPYAFCGSGFPVLKDYQMIGVLKAYTTRVGEGPFPTRLTKEEELNMREKGGEYGATTGRGRNCGWLDLFAVKYAAFINSIDNIVITKMDILSDMKTIKICTGYKIGNKVLKSYPSVASDLDKVTPVYKSVKGWTSTELDNLKKGKMSPSIRNFIAIIEKYSNAKVTMISNGPSRKDIIYLEKP